jgi:hypothetical protein
MTNVVKNAIVRQDRAAEQRRVYVITVRHVTAKTAKVLVIQALIVNTDVFATMVNAGRIPVPILLAQTA